MKRCLVFVFALLSPASAMAQTQTITAEQREFFEKKVRPVLAEHCYACHSATAKKLKADLRLDSRAGMLSGGDLGPAIVPGHPAKSRLIEAITYKNVDLKMPPKTKLPDPVIADLTAWVKMGAPWPDEKLIKKNTYSAFNLEKRKQEHWSWQPIRVPAVPKVTDTAWPKGDVDRFVLAKLEAKGIKPAGDADPRTLLRRLYFDLIGLPPTRADVDEFVAAWEAPSAKRQAVIAKVVDKLLDSPQFGERWARHWLDLVRYAESRGHEFDFTIPNAYHYRDYVIRALNNDVPYNQFVHEHIAGDLLKNPRLGRRAGSVSDRSEDTFNESILGTAFWFLGEECHSPVDIRQDQADRFDNRIDVMTKTFLGLTVACARCHDHKFDAISTKDYYALFGILESCNYRLARFDTMTHNRKVAEQLAELRETSRKPLLEAMIRAAAPMLDQMDAGNGKRLRQQIEEAIAADPHETQLFDFEGAEVVVDYRKPRPNDWLPDDVSFGLGPMRAGEIILGKSPARPIERAIVHAAAEYDRVWGDLKLTAGTQNESGALGSMARAGRTLSTPEFVLKNGKAFALVKGSGMIYAGVGQHIMLAGPLHGSLVQRFNTPDRFQWVAVDLMPYIGQRARLEFTPSDNADLAIIAVVQGPRAPGVLPTNSFRPGLGKLKDGDSPPLLDWFVQNANSFIVPDSEEAKTLATVAAPILEKQAKLLAQIRHVSRLTPAMHDGSGTDEFVFVRGNPKSPGPIVPRRYLEALGGGDFSKGPGSGRLELAQQMTDPALTPFITRVHVNRVWHHLFGRGIVASVDNFGVLGEAPTHPELLDYLANRFVAEGWSTKKLIRTLVLTRAYQMSSVPDATADVADPSNLLLHRMRLRRLEGEAIRDSILRVSGRLKATMYGPSVPVYLTPFQDGRGRPGSGPLDGDGRRSIYLAVRRNFLSSFLLAFDTPAPFSTVGRRTVSNVPAQALILMNDPFVHGQADLWAKRVIAAKASDAERVRGMYLDAFSRPPTDVELQACVAYLGMAPDVRRWADLAHVLINTKEFYFVN
jgi:hypothetical protein